MTRKCGECRFFKTKTRVGRTYRSCEDLGETRYADACDSFHAAASADPPLFIPNEFELALGFSKSQREPIAPTVGGAVALALARRFQYDRQSVEAIQRVLIDLQESGPIVVNGVERVADPSDLKSFQEVVDKLIDLLSTKELIYGLGLSDFLDHIMTLRTEALFHKRPVVLMPPAPPGGPSGGVQEAPPPQIVRRQPAQPAPVVAPRPRR